MKRFKRKILPHELEKDFEKPPFLEFSLKRGTTNKANNYGILKGDLDLDFYFLILILILIFYFLIFFSSSTKLKSQHRYLGVRIRSYQTTRS